MAETVAASQLARPIIEIRDLRKVYRRDRQELTVLDGIDLEVPDGAFEALMGPSGSGKTTLLNLIAGIDAPTSGSIRVAGEEIAKLSETARAQWRARNIGFIFQFYNLMPVLTAAENVELPLLLTRLPRSERVRRVEVALKLVACRTASTTPAPALRRPAAAGGDRARRRRRPRSSSPTSPPATWIARARRKCWGCSGPSTRPWARRC